MSRRVALLDLRLEFEVACFQTFDEVACMCPPDRGGGTRRLGATRSDRAAMWRGRFEPAPAERYPKIHVQDLLPSKGARGGTKVRLESGAVGRVKEVTG